jgi:nitrogen fixation protein NifU and related proteins
MTPLYQHQLMDHYRNPRNQGTLEGPHFKSGIFNPSCGDSVAIEGVITDYVITHVAFQGSGCVISQATASLLTQAVKGKAVHEVIQLDSSWIMQLIGIELGPVRLKCALLPLEALHEGIKQYQAQ